MHKQLGKYYFWVCLQGCFQERLAFDSVVKSQECPQQGRLGSSNLSEHNEDRGRANVFSLLELVPSSLLPSNMGGLGAQTFRLGLNHTTGCFGESSLQEMGL